MCVIKIHAFTSMGRPPLWSGTSITSQGCGVEVVLYTITGPKCCSNKTLQGQSVAVVKCYRKRQLGTRSVRVEMSCDRFEGGGNIQAQWEKLPTRRNGRTKRSGQPAVLCCTYSVQYLQLLYKNNRNDNLNVVAARRSTAASPLSLSLPGPILSRIYISTISMASKFLCPYEQHW
jgi:hypothetical protein